MDARAVLVIGGGPAGLATAFHLAKAGIAATVIERGGYDDVRVGEHLQPAGVLKLREICSRADLPLDAHFSSAGVVAYWGSEAAQHMDYFMHPGRHGLNLSRPRFDADFAKACELSGVKVWRCARLLRTERRGSAWDTEIGVNGRVRTLSASVVVDATGRAATFARRQGAQIQAHDRQVAVVAFGGSTDGNANHTKSIIEAAECGWWYSAPVDSERRVQMLVTDDDLLPRGRQSDLRNWWRTQLDRCAHLRPLSVDPSARLHVRSARSQCLDSASGTGWLAVGDAAIALDPLSSQGIAKALDHGKRAAASILSYFSGDSSSLEDFAVERRREYSDYRLTRTRYYRLETRWKHAVFWKRRGNGHGLRTRTRLPTQGV